jgi:flagellum-specific peptidoglycan hydrolase FlgJ
MAANILESLRLMKPADLERFGEMHKSDPYMFSLAFNESNIRKKVGANAQMQSAQQPPVNEQALQGMRADASVATPEDSGIAQLNTGDMNYAEGGIVAFAGGGKPKADPVQEFATEYRSLAEQAGAELGVDPGLIIAQWGHETGWGRGVPGKNNLGNIKGKGTSAYDSLEKSRSQYKNYESPEAFMQDYVSQIKRNFPDAVGAGGDIGQFTKGLQKGRLGAYASDPAYAKKMASAVTKVLPMGPAQAAEVPATATAAQTPEAAPYSSISRYLPFGGEAGYEVPRALLQNLGAQTVGGLAGLAGAVLPGPEGQGADVAKKVQSALGYAPKSEVSRGILEKLGVPTALLDEYVASPAGEYLAEAGYPALGATVKGATTAAPMALGLRGGPKAKPPAAAPTAPVAAPVTAPAAPTYTPRPVSAQQMAAGRGAPPLVGPPMPNPAQVAAQLVGPAKPRVSPAAAAPAASVAAAPARAGLASLAERAAGITGRTSRAAIPTSMSAAATSAVGADEENEEPYSTGEYQGKSGDPDTDIGPLTPATEKKITTAAKATMTPEERKESGFTSDDWLTLGFSLLSSKSPQFMEALGSAGLATLAGKQARTKAGLEAQKTAADIAQSGAMSKYYGAAAERYAREDRPQLAYQKALDDAVADLDKDFMYKSAKPAEKLRMENEVRARARANFLAANPALADTIGAGAATGIAAPQGVKVTRVGP